MFYIRFIIFLLPLTCVSQNSSYSDYSFDINKFLYKINEFSSNNFSMVMNPIVYSRSTISTQTKITYMVNNNVTLETMGKLSYGERDATPSINMNFVINLSLFRFKKNTIRFIDF